MLQEFMVLIIRQALIITIIGIITIRAILTMMVIEIRFGVMMALLTLCTEMIIGATLLIFTLQDMNTKVVFTGQSRAM